MTHKQDNFGLRVASYNIRKTKGRGGRRDPYRTLEVINSLDDFTLISTHLGLTRFHRKAQLTALVRALKDKSTSLILGDFNEWSPTQGMEPLEARFDIHSPGRTFHAARPMAALDRIALDRSIRLMDAGVTETKLAKRASDHLPIWADVSIP